MKSIPITSELRECWQTQLSSLPDPMVIAHATCFSLQQEQDLGKISREFMIWFWGRKERAFMGNVASAVFAGSREISEIEIRETAV